MDGNRFDQLSRTLAAGVSRRVAVKGIAAAALAALGIRQQADAQVSLLRCGNVVCKKNPEKCAPGCVCCVFPNGNSRCLPSGTCSFGTVACPAGQIFDPARGCVVPECLSDADCPQSPANSCRRRVCSGGTCLATDEWAPDGALCGIDGQCDDGRCFRSARNRACFNNVTEGCSPFVIDLWDPELNGRAQFCLGYGNGSEAPCTSTADCPAGEICAALVDRGVCVPGCPG